MLNKNFILIFSFILSLILIQSCTDNSTGVNQTIKHKLGYDPNIHFGFTVYQHSNCDAGQYSAEVELWDADANIVAGPTLTDEYGKVDWPANWPAGYYTVRVWYLPRPNNTQCIVKLVYFDATDFSGESCLELCDIEF